MMMGQEERKEAVTNVMTTPGALKLSVHALLVAKGIKQKDIALKYGIAASDLNRVVHRLTRTLHIRQKIASELGMNFVEVWGEPEKR